MKPEDALRLLDQAVSQINTSRPGHVQLQQAIECLKKFVADATPSKEPEEENGSP